MFDNVANGMSDNQSALPLEERQRLVREACVASNAHNFVEELQDVSSVIKTKSGTPANIKKGYLTEVGEGAGTLSVSSIPDSSLSPALSKSKASARPRVNRLIFYCISRLFPEYDTNLHRLRAASVSELPSHEA